MRTTVFSLFLTKRYIKYYELTIFPTSFEGRYRSSTPDAHRIIDDQPTRTSLSVSDAVPVISSSGQRNIEFQGR